MMTSLKRIIRSAWINLQRQGSLTFATLFIMVLTIFFITSLFLFYLSTQFIISELKEKIDISIYFKERTLSEDIFQTKDEISKIPEVKNVEYVSKEDALETFIQRHKDDLNLMESLAEVGGNPFLASLNIKVWQATQYDKILTLLETSAYKDLIEKIDYHQRKPVIDRIFSITNTINSLGIILILVLSLIAILVAFNTIRLAIYNSGEEIRIQRLVGASNWFIRGPFLAQGAIVGVFSVFIALFITLLITYFLSPKIANLFTGLNLFGYFVNNFGVIILIQLFTGIGIGIVSSMIAIRRYLEV